MRIVEVSGLREGFIFFWSVLKRAVLFCMENSRLYVNQTDQQEFLTTGEEVNSRKRGKCLCLKGVGTIPFRLFVCDGLEHVNKPFNVSTKIVIGVKVCFF